MNLLLRPALGKLIPLSEDARLVLDTPRYLQVEQGQSKNWDEVTVMAPGERRVISLEIHVAANARGRMVRVFKVPKGARLTLLHKAQVGEGGEWQSVIGIRGEGEVIIRRATDVLDTGACASILCAAVLEHSGLISVADEIFTSASETKSELRTKIVLKDAARSEVRGRIVVDEQSKAGQAYERLDHLVFGDKATAAAIPELEVRTDDVKCGHGATTSRPSDDELFYLTSRGLSVDQANRVITGGFLGQVFTHVPEDVKQKSFEVLLG